MRVYLIRHTQTAAVNNICYGQTDVDVHKNFAIDLATIQATLPALYEPRIYSSPLQRCSKLAAQLFPKQPVQTCPDLQEIDFGDWEMRSWNDIDRQQIDAWANDIWHYPIPNGETVQQFYQRCISCWQHILADTSNQPPVLITHAGVIRAIKAFVLQEPFEALLQDPIAYGQIITLDVDKGHASQQLSESQTI